MEVTKEYLQRCEYAKDYILDRLGNEGFRNYAYFLAPFDFVLVDDPDMVAAMLPGKAKIIINQNLDSEQILTVVRHEALHELLKHHARMEQKFAAQGKDWEKRTGKQHELANIAGDYEISNLGYEEADKDIVRNLKINDRLMRGLVTEDDHPDWVNKSYEEMYDLLSAEWEKEKQDALDQIKQAMQNQQENSDDQNSDDNDISDQGWGKITDEIAELLDEIDKELYGDSNSENKSDSSEQPSGKGASSTEDPQDSDNTQQSNQSSDSNKLSDETLQDVKKELSKIGNEAEETANNSDDTVNGKISPFAPSSDSEKNKLSELEGKIAAIKDFLDNPDSYQNTISEITRIKNLHNQKRKGSGVDKDVYANSPSAKFEMDLNRFIKDGVKSTVNPSWGRINKTYVNSRLVRPGRRHEEKFQTALINVYFDQSGSWDDEKIAVGKSIISKLLDYEKRKIIKVNVYYFANDVDEKPDHNHIGYGTNGRPIVEHIKKTQPNNVIIMTDSDISDIRESIMVPGAVWLLFKGGVSKNLIDHIHGKLSTKIFELE